MKIRLSAGTNQNTSPARRFVKTPTSQACKEGKQSRLETAGSVQARPFSGVFRFGSAAKEVTETKSSLIALQELPSHQDRVENQVHITKKPSCWSKFEKSE